MGHFAELTRGSPADLHRGSLADHHLACNTCGSNAHATYMCAHAPGMPPDHFGGGRVALAPYSARDGTALPKAKPPPSVSGKPGERVHSWVRSINRHLLVAGRLREHKLYAKLSKCQFGRTQVEFLGHVISAEGIGMDRHKVKAVQDWPRPVTMKDVMQFLGLTGYYRRFVEAYAEMAVPLHELPKKGNNVRLGFAATRSIRCTETRAH